VTVELPQAPVLDLADIRVSDIPRVGPKVARLGQLARDGWRVPDGYAITADALASWLPPHLPPEEAESRPVPAWLEDAVINAHERLTSRTGLGPGLRVSVRSSALSEDGAAASFAGQFATYLGVRGADDVLRHTRKCWASGFTAHAQEYRRRHAGPDSSHQLAVGVLELVDVRTAGVVFTVDPVSGDRDRLVVEANWGFGESVVSGLVTPDHWEVDRATGHILTEHVTVKSTWSALDLQTGTVTLQPLPDDLAPQACLAAHEVRYLCRQALAIEESDGGTAQDVEWAIARDLPFPDSVFILQHRPVTTLSPSPAAPRPAPPPPPAAFDPVQYALRNVFKVPGS
jgi:pyruvate, water dikinase